MLAVGLVLCLPNPTAGQTPAATPAPQAAVQPGDGSRDGAQDFDLPTTPAELARIKKALSETPTVTLDRDKLRFYLRILAREPRFEDFIGSYDLKNGPVKRAPMTHQEFLNMVTPKEVYSSAGITATDMIQFAITNWLGQSLVKKAIEDMRNAKSEAEVQAIRERIDKELAALRGGGGGG